MLNLLLLEELFENNKTTKNPKQNFKKQSSDLKKRTNIYYLIFKRSHDKLI